MTDPSLRRLEALERQHAGMLAQRRLDRDRIEALEARCAKLEAAVLSVAAGQRIILDAEAFKAELSRRGVTLLP